MTMLEFASGYGCVTCHLSTVLPKLQSVACDIHAQAAKFFHERLNSEVMLSCDDPDEFVDKGQYDVVFALSFFSQMPETTWSRWLKALYAAVKPGGALIFTTQGEHNAKYFGDPDLGADGFWFVADSEQKDLDVAAYGQTIVSEAFVQHETKAMPGRAADLVRSGYWWEHQDFYVVRKPDAPILDQSERIAG
jgi:SAM-dependent methyltransferase